MEPTLVMEQSFPPTWECDGWHPCIHHSKWRLSGLRCSHGWVKVYHSAWQPFTSTLRWSSPWSMSGTLLDCLQEWEGVCRKTERPSETTQYLLYFGGCKVPRMKAEWLKSSHYIVKSRFSHHLTELCQLLRKKYRQNTWMRAAGL